MNKSVQQEINEVLKPAMEFLDWCMKQTEQNTIEATERTVNNHEQVKKEQKQGN